MKSSRAWLEYIEGELSPSQAIEMEMLLVHSPTDRRILQNLEKVRNAVKEVDPAIPPAEPAFYDSLHDKIMARLEKTEIQKPAPKTVRPFRGLAVRGWLPAKFKNWLPFDM
ncbi:MAG: anti-sigma factor [Pseudobdellovibrionaceae bacterium]